MSESVEYDKVDEGYLEKRSLRRTAGPVLLWGLGVGYVIPGDFFGWNFGLNAAGFGGMFIAVLVMATLYAALIVSIAELATMMPVAGGPYAFARRALGPWGGFVTGLAVTIEYVVAPAVIATGIGGYVAGMFADPPPWLASVVPVVAYAIFVGINLLGSRFSLALLFGITGVSVAVLLLWAIAVAPHAELSRAFDVAPTVAGGTSFLPHGVEGIVAALPAAGWFYLAVEGVPLAAEETRDPARDLPRGMIAAMLSLIALSMLVLWLAPAVGGTARLATSDNPLPAAAEAVSGRGVVYWTTTVVGLAGLVASLFGIIFAYSRQIFALSRAGYLPRWLSRTNRHRAPHWALVVPAIVGWGAIVLAEHIAAGRVKSADLLMQIAVFAALLSYAMMMVSHIVLRRRFPDANRPYRTPLYPLPPVLAFVLSIVAMTSTIFYAEAASGVVLGALAVFGAGLLYFFLWSRHHLVATAPEEEAALVRAAEAELDA